MQPAKAGYLSTREVNVRVTKQPTEMGLILSQSRNAINNACYFGSQQPPKLHPLSQMISRRVMGGPSSPPPPTLIQPPRLLGQKAQLCFALIRMGPALWSPRGEEGGRPVLGVTMAGVGQDRRSLSWSPRRRQECLFAAEAGEAGQAPILPCLA